MKKGLRNLVGVMLFGGTLLLGACGNDDATKSNEHKEFASMDDYSQYKGVEKTVREFVGDNFKYGHTAVSEVNTQDGKTVVIKLTQENAKAEYIGRYSSYIVTEVGAKEGKVKKLTLLWNDGDAKYVAERSNKTQMTITKEIVNVD